MIKFSVAARFNRAEMQQLRYWKVLVACLEVSEVGDQIWMESDGTIVRKFPDRTIRFRINPRSLKVEAFEKESSEPSLLTTEETRRLLMLAINRLHLVETC